MLAYRDYMGGLAPELAALADAVATVGGTTLQMHTQILAKECTVIAQLAVTMQEGGRAPSVGAPLDCTQLFSEGGTTLVEAQLLLFLLYHPESMHLVNQERDSHHAIIGFDTLEVEADLLGAIRLAHRLGADAFIRRVWSRVKAGVAPHAPWVLLAEELQVSSSTPPVCVATRRISVSTRGPLVARCAAGLDACTGALVPCARPGQD